MDWRFQSSLGSLLLYKILIFVTQFVNKNSSSYTTFMGLASYKYAEGYFKVDTWHHGACHALIIWYYDIVFASKMQVERSRGSDTQVECDQVMDVIWECLSSSPRTVMLHQRESAVRGAVDLIVLMFSFYWRSKSFVYWFTAQHQQTRIWCLWQKVPWLSENTRRAGA